MESVFPDLSANRTDHSDTLSRSRYWKLRFGWPDKG